MLKESKIGITLHKAGLLYLISEEFECILVQNYSRDYSDYRIQFFSGGLFNVYKFWLVNGCKETLDELAVISEDILIK